MSKTSAFPNWGFVGCHGYEDEWLRVPLRKSNCAGAAVLYIWQLWFDSQTTVSFIFILYKLLTVLNLKRLQWPYSWIWYLHCCVTSLLTCLNLLSGNSKSQFNHLLPSPIYSTPLIPVSPPPRVPELSPVIKMVCACPLIPNDKMRLIPRQHW